jgi:predicted DNA-binding protein (MmcQ/YjbR family)
MPTDKDAAENRSLDEPLVRLRRLCLALPHATERLSHGEPTWFVDGKRSFVMFADHHHDDRLACWCAASPVAQRALIDAHPTRYFYPPYVGHRGWLGVYLDVPVDWDEMADLVRDAYRLVAPKRALAELDALE